MPPRSLCQKGTGSEPGSPHVSENSDPRGAGPLLTRPARAFSLVEALMATAVLAIVAAAAATKAWYYDDATGEFKANDGGTTNGVAHDTL